MSETGLAHLASVTADLDGGADTLAVGSRLRTSGIDPHRAAALVGAAVTRRRARDRWPDADRLVFTRAGLEQASDPAVSRWRARRLADAPHLEDRAAGCGGDSLALAAAGASVTAIDADEGRLILLRHNAVARGLTVDTVVADALVHPPPATGPVHADPGRRVDGRRVRRLSEHRPSVPALLDHLASVREGPGVAVVLGPGVDLADPDLPADAELEFVQVGWQLVEAVVWTGALRQSGVRATATVLDRDASVDRPTATRTGGARGERLRSGPIGSVLLEVAPAAVRARLHDDIGAEVGAHRIADRRALLTAPDDPGPSPWYRRRVVEAVLPARADAVRRHLAASDDRPYELVLHGLDTDLAAFRRGLRGLRSGPGGRRIELVRTDDGAVAIVTTDPT
ncbi:MAG: hypothetical protein WEB03_14125 [Nitriliruptor sp.]|uniref:hypothetical protein n=1 Tax=Nitriliruptor sp. TaxID=2448056 RepID=UPI0034A08AE7